jgi:hypothetical protein
MVSVRTLRADTIENTKMKDIIRDLEERERARVVLGDVTGGVHAGREVMEDDEVAHGKARPTPPGSRGGSRGGTRPTPPGSRGGSREGGSNQVRERRERRERSFGEVKYNN